MQAYGGAARVAGQGAANPSSDTSIKQPRDAEENIRQPSGGNEQEPFVSPRRREASEEETHGAVSIDVGQARGMLIEASGRRTGEYAR